MKYKLPPLGIKPRWLHEEQRQQEIISAIQRRLDDGETMIPAVWIDEYNELVDARSEHENLHNHCSICSTLNASILGQMITTDGFTNTVSTLPADYCPRCGAKIRRIE